MVSNFFNSIKSAFVTEIPDESTVAEKPVDTQKPIDQQPMFVMPNLVSFSEKVIEGQVDDALLQKLCQAMEDSNLPGPDYLELKNVANNEEMKKAMPNELQRLTVAFITMKSSSPEMTKERVLTSIDEYVKMMENERKNGHEQLNVIWKEKVESKENSISESEKRIAKLQEELQELIQYVQKQTNEVAIAINECNINKANFDATVDFLVNNLTEDRAKLTNILF